MRLLNLAAAAVLAMTMFASQASAQPLRDELPAPPGGDAARETGFLGLYADDPEIPGKGVVVTSVHAGGPAEAAGIKKGDLVAAVEGKPIATVDEMQEAIGAAPVGKKLKVEVIRGGRHIVHTITLTRRPAAAPADDPRLPLETPVRPAVPGPAVPGPGTVPLDVGTRATLGVRLLPLTDEARLKYSIVARSGAVIEAIREGSPADKFGLPLGGVIFSFDGRRIDSPDQVVDALRATRPGDEVEIGYYQGDRMFRKLVRLSPAAAPAAADSPLVAPSGVPGAKPLPGLSGLSERPGVKKLEGLLDRLLPPAAGPGPAPDADLTVPRAAEDRREVTELRSEIELLKAEIARLTKRLADVETRLPEKK